MSVVLLGMEMPRICGECEGHFLSGDGHVCCNLTNRIPKIVAKFNNNMMDLVARKESIDSVVRPDWCPLRPLLEKHGRLGDLDELKTSFADSINECKKWIKELEENGDNETLPLANQAFCTFVEAALRLKSIPTIVEAEGDE